MSFLLIDSDRVWSITIAGISVDGDVLLFMFRIRLQMPAQSLLS